MGSDEYYMHRALDQAHLALAAGEVPIGAVVVNAAGDIIGEGFNAPVTRHDPTAHAEIRALRDAGERLGNYRLGGCSLFVTVEPCLMCTGAIIQARIKRLVYGVAEPKTGMAESRANLFAQPWFNHMVLVDSGVRSGKARRLMREFFAARRLHQQEVASPSKGQVSDDPNWRDDTSTSA
ncbi:tRNA adenosine(34) deaminase TadA [Kushneria phosphatilytica]|uniref:tRNA-specific adenosine deaminase n=1 Tax=Kushneria phosphatilytica TaxID=657387 RepID=A0A1S1NYI8_9GAMM|nr:tRNA adenosine(34) deaminase TadA [Kushneria phosphatilytica]OHV13945.1 tRNA-specific adenosine deaminase [Kushneria phosphatilytica]QEL10509.1 nucleoside deaminase [Kushneria phosphatilytica]